MKFQAKADMDDNRNILDQNIIPRNPAQKRKCMLNIMQKFLMIDILRLLNNEK